MQTNTSSQHKKSSSQMKSSKKDDERILQLVEKNEWWPFDRVDGRLLVKLHKQQSTTTYEEAPI